jgi:hypothetical protein
MYAASVKSGAVFFLDSAMAKMGRPSIYTQNLADNICNRLALGDSLRKICADDEMPDLTTIMEWIRNKPDFSKQYAQAREEQAETYADQLIHIADEESDDVNRARLRIDTRKWVAMKLKPKKYGDKIGIGGADDLPPIEIKEMSAIELAKRTAFLLRAGLEEIENATDSQG